MGWRILPMHDFKKCYCIYILSIEIKVTVQRKVYIYQKITQIVDENWSYSLVKLQNLLQISKTLCKDSPQMICADHQSCPTFPLLTGWKSITCSGRTSGCTSKAVFTAQSDCLEELGWHSLRTFLHVWHSVVQTFVFCYSCTESFTN